MNGITGGVHSDSVVCKVVKTRVSSHCANVCVCVCACVCDSAALEGAYPHVGKIFIGVEQLVKGVERQLRLGSDRLRSIKSILTGKALW
jgi:hypothetical protein